jgi:hypothetical protein
LKSNQARQVEKDDGRESEGRTGKSSVPDTVDVYIPGGEKERGGGTPENLENVEKVHAASGRLGV